MSDLPLQIQNALANRGLKAVPEEIEHEHWWVLLGASLCCLHCGEDGGVTSIALPDIDWDEWRRIHDVVEAEILIRSDSFKGLLHPETAANYFASIVAYALTPEKP